MKKILLSSLIAASIMLGSNEEVIKPPVNCDKFLQMADDSLNIAIEKLQLQMLEVQEH